MDMGMNGGANYAPLYSQAKEILAAGMLAELKEDADEAMKGESEGEDTCPHCGSPMGGGMGKMGMMPKMGLGGMEAPEAPTMPDLSQFAMRVPAPPMMGRQPAPAMPPMM